MTIALGMLASDGLIIAADSQVTAGDWKRSHGKVNCFVWDGETPDPISIVMTGAGTLSYLGAAWEAVRPAMTPGIAVDDLKAAIAARIKQFHREHIRPFAAYPPGERPWVELLFGVERRRSIAELWHSEFSALTDVTPFQAVGTGQNYAMSILERLYRYPFMPCEETALLAGHVIHLVKDSDTSCGKDTEIICIRRGRWQQVPGELTDAIDRASEDYGRKVEPFLLRRAFGRGGEDANALLDQAGFVAVLKDLRVEWFPSILPEGR